MFIETIKKKYINNMEDVYKIKKKSNYFQNLG